MQSTNGTETDIDQLWDYNQPAASEARFRQRLATLLPDAPLYGELLTQLARAQGLQRQFAEAHHTLDEVEAQLAHQSARTRLRYLLERGRVYNSAQQPASARPLFLQAWEQAQAAGEDFYAVDAAHMLGIIEPADQQLLWHHQALAVAEQSADPRARKWLGSLYNNIGWTYHDLRREEEALAIFQKALAWRQAQGQERAIQIAQWCIGRILRALDRLDEAFACQQALQQALEQSGVADGYVQEELGECLLLLNRSAEAKPHFAAAYVHLIQDPWLVENEAERLARLRTLGEVASR